MLRNVGGDCFGRTYGKIPEVISKWVPGEISKRVSGGISREILEGIFADLLEFCLNRFQICEFRKESRKDYLGISLHVPWRNQRRIFWSNLWRDCPSINAGVISEKILAEIFLKEYLKESLEDFLEKSLKNKTKSNRMNNLWRNMRKNSGLWLEQILEESLKKFMEEPQ